MAVRRRPLSAKPQVGKPIFPCPPHASRQEQLAPDLAENPLVKVGAQVLGSPRPPEPALVQPVPLGRGNEAGSWSGTSPRPAQPSRKGSSTTPFSAPASSPRVSGSRYGRFSAYVPPATIISVSQARAAALTSRQPRCGRSPAHTCYAASLIRPTGYHRDNSRRGAVARRRAAARRG